MEKPPQLTFEQFQASRQWHDDLSKTQAGVDFGETPAPGFLYAESCYILKLTEGDYAGQYDLQIERDEWTSANLEELEKRLYRWAVDAGVCIAPVEQDRLNEAVDKAEGAFWASIADSYPECKTGDLDPWQVTTLIEAMRLAAKHWVRWNRPADADDTPTKE